MAIIERVCDPKEGVMRNEGYYKLLGAVVKSAMVDYAGLGREVFGCGMSKKQQLDSANLFIDQIEDILEGFHIPNARSWGGYIKRKAKEMKRDGEKQTVLTVYPRCNQYE